MLAKGPYAYLLSMMTSDGKGADYVPKMYQDTMKRPDLWVPAMEEELKMMDNRGVFELVEETSVLRGKNIVGC